MHFKKLLSWISLGFGSGLSPIGPGTSGSILALVLYYFLIDPLVNDALSGLVLIISLMGAFLLGIYVYRETVTGEEDPGSFVWDEFVGMWIACLPITLYINLGLLTKSYWWFILAFVLFRIFDIWKPNPIKYFDNKAGGFYVMMDDVAAGFISGLIVLMAILFTIN